MARVWILHHCTSWGTAPASPQHGPGASPELAQWHQCSISDCAGLGPGPNCTGTCAAPAAVCQSISSCASIAGVAPALRLVRIAPTVSFASLPAHAIQQSLYSCCYAALPLPLHLLASYNVVMENRWLMTNEELPPAIESPRRQSVRMLQILSLDSRMASPLSLAKFHPEARLGGILNTVTRVRSWGTILSHTCS